MRGVDRIGTDRGCGRCGEQIELVVETPGVDSTTSSLRRLLDTGIDEQVIVIAQCGCPKPRFVGLRGEKVPEDKI